MEFWHPFLDDMWDTALHNALALTEVAYTAYLERWLDSEKHHIVKMEADVHFWMLPFID